jgi:hypothetical protein
LAFDADTARAIDFEWERRMARRITAVLVAIVLGVAGSGCSTSTGSSNEQNHDQKGFPLDANGNVSSNPDDYRESVCNTESAKEAPDYEQECK